MSRQKPFFDTASAALLAGVLCVASASAAVVDPFASSSASVDWSTFSVSGDLTPSVFFTGVGADETPGTNLTSASNWTTPLSISFQDPSMSAMSSASADADSLSADSSARAGSAGADAVRAGQFQFSNDGQASISVAYDLDASLQSGGTEAFAAAFLTLEINGVSIGDEAGVNLIDPSASESLSGTLQLLDFSFQAGDVANLNVNVTADTMVAPVPLPGALVLLASALVPILGWNRIQPS